MASHREDRKLQLLRVNQLAVMVVLIFLILFARLWYLQIAKGDELLKQADANRIKFIRSRAPRGTIIDCKGRVIATSRPQFVVMAIPQVLKQNKVALHTLCGILRISVPQLEEIIRKRQGRPGSPIRIAIDVPMETVACIREMRMLLPGVSVELDHIRFYPDGPVVAHIVGSLGEINEDELKKGRHLPRPYRLGDFVGKAGLEKQYESDLRGVDGGNRVEVNAAGRVIRILGPVPPIPGHTLQLTIDRDLQLAAAKALGKQVGAVVAIDPATGAVRAMVSSPQYDPNVFVKGVSPSDWSKITSNKDHPLQNRCVYNSYPPGSTFKPLMAIAGLLYHACNVRTSVSCQGHYYLGRARFGCWRAHGGVDFIKAIAQSCDVWFYSMSRRLGIEKMAKVAREFGIGRATGIDLPCESRRGNGRVGIMPDPQWKQARVRERWYPGNTLNTVIGQGDVQVTPLQMAVACAGIANCGAIYQPYLVDRVLTPGGNLIRATKVELVNRVDAPREAFRLVQQGMRAAVTAGTGGVCNVQGVAVCGKTGSAENPGAAHGWFICFAPMENPRIAVACIVEHGRHGATSAAPVCRAVLDVFFGKKKPAEIGQIQSNARGD